MRVEGERELQERERVERVERERVERVERESVEKVLKKRELKERES